MIGRHSLWICGKALSRIGMFWFLQREWINQQKGRLRDEMYFNSILKGSFFVMKHFGQSQELQKKRPRKVNNLTDSPHGICELSIAFTEVQRINNIHCFMEFPWLLLFKPIRSLVQTTFLNWNIFSSWRSPLNCLSLQYYWCRLSVYLTKTFYCALWREISWPSAQKGDWKPGFT